MIHPFIVENEIKYRQEELDRKYKHFDPTPWNIYNDEKTKKRRKSLFQSLRNLLGFSIENEEKLNN
jgi:hypothetical protein